MKQEKIDRINWLAKKSKTEGLTSEELEEQAILRREYIDDFKKNLKAQLDRIEIVDGDKDERKNG
ncbi:MAG: DUF896 domain-containing protein [Eubacterium sp.]|nr:DUF896 domain-containing protein [Eubacterium sp.]